MESKVEGPATYLGSLRGEQLNTRYGSVDISPSYGELELLRTPMTSTLRGRMDFCVKQCERSTRLLGSSTLPRRIKWWNQIIAGDQVRGGQNSY